MRLGIYARTSTGNPTGRRPWNSRLSFYIPNTFALPTTGRGPFLLQPGVGGRPMQAGGVPGGMSPGLSFYRPAQFPLPTTSMSRPLSGLGQHGRRRRRMMGAFATPPLTVRHFNQQQLAPASGSGPGVIGLPQPPLTANLWRAGSGYGSGQSAPSRQNSPFAGAGSQEGFTPIGNTGLYTSSAADATQAAAQGYYQIGMRNGQPVYSTNPGQLATAQQGQITGYDAAGNPIYSTPPAGAYQIGTDAYGNPIYSNNPNAAQIASALEQAPQNTSAETTEAAAATTTSTESWFSEDSLGLGLNNAWYLGIGAVALYMFTSKRR